MRFRVLYRLLRGAHFSVCAEVVAGVVVSVEAREIGRGHFDSNPVPLLKDIAGDGEIDLVAIGFIGLEQLGFGKALAIARPDDAIAEILGVSTG